MEWWLRAANRRRIVKSARFSVRCPILGRGRLVM
jgi:hypothetical protein